MAYEVVMSYHLHMPSYFLGTFTEYPYFVRYIRIIRAFFISSLQLVFRFIRRPVFGRFLSVILFL